MGMYDFNDIHAASKSEQIRAYSVERALEHFQINRDAPSGQELICLAKMVEDYVTNGDVTGAITTAVEEGYSEGRYEVYEALRNQGVPLTQTELRNLFIEKGWMPNRPEPGTTQVH